MREVLVRTRRGAALLESESESVCRVAPATFDELLAPAIVSLLLFLFVMERVGEECESERNEGWMDGWLEFTTGGARFVIGARAFVHVVAPDAERFKEEENKTSSHHHTILASTVITLSLDPSRSLGLSPLLLSRENHGRFGSIDRYAYLAPRDGHRSP